MKRFWAQPLRRQLFIAILLLLVPVLAAAIWSGYATHQERTEDLAIQSRTVAASAAAWIDRDVDALDRGASVFTSHEFIRTLDPSASRDLLQRALPGRRGVIDILLARADGTIVAQGASVPSGHPGTEWIARAVSEKRRVVLSLPTSSGLPNLLLAYPVKSDNAIVGALAFVVDMGATRDALANLPLPEGSLVTVVDERQRVIVHSAAARGTLGASLASNGRVSEPGQPDADGIARIYAAAEIEHGPWLVHVGIPEAVARARTIGFWTRSVTILALGLAGWLIVVVVLSRRLGDAVSHLDGTAKRIASGDFSPMQHRAPISREFADLQMAFDAMLNQFNTTRAALDSQMGEERRIRQELESLQGQVIRQERLAAVGQLVSGVAHEINNPLQAILGFSELLQMQSDVPEDVKGDLRLIQKESARACGIIRNLALFARQQPGEAAPVHLSDVITSVAELRQRRLESEDIELRIEHGSGQPVLAVLTELQQVLLNFVVNAEQSVLTSGRLPGRITLRSYDHGDRVVLEVEDTGPGIPPEHEAKLFQPFFTTKPVGQGTGLGLSVSYGIIDSLGGHIGYRRAKAGGAIFYFELPAAA